MAQHIISSVSTRSKGPVKTEVHCPAHAANRQRQDIGANFSDYLNTVIVASGSDGTFSTFTGKEQPLCYRTIFLHAAPHHGAGGGDHDAPDPQQNGGTLK